MPLIEVKLYDTRVADEAQVQLIIDKLMDGLAEAIGEGIREHTWVIVEGIPKNQWGRGSESAQS
jgi:4-oxalocrotonate tautomerase